VEFLSWEKFQQIAEENMEYNKNGRRTGHWEKYEKRWSYHARAISIIKSSSTEDPEKVLEMGTMGTSVVVGSHTFDYDERWNFKGFSPTYLHDARLFPWPIEDKKYEWFVALRVFHHLWPLQRRCFLEAARIARNLLIVVPGKVDRKYRKKAYCEIKYHQFLVWNNGVPPSIFEKLPSFGNLYCWDAIALSAEDSIADRANRLFAHITKIKGV